MSRIRIAVMFAISMAACAWSALAQQPPPHNTVVDRNAGADAVSDRLEDLPTAEQLLRALRRQRVEETTIAPASAPGGVWPIAQKKLLPEGSSIVSRTGWVTRDKDDWRFQFDPADEGDPSIRLLPNTDLEVMVRTSQAAPQPVMFLISGDVTAYEEENYLLVRFVRRAGAATSNSDAGSAAIAQPVTSAAAPGADDGASANPGATSEASADDVLAIMQAQAPTEAVLTPESTLPAERLKWDIGSAKWPEGAAIIARPGRLVREGDWWTFVFESDDPDHPEPPLRLLWSASVEMMIQTAQHGERGLVFLVSGEVTAFGGQNYLLPTLVTRRIDMGNLSK